MDSKFKPAYLPLNKRITGLIVGINHTLDLNQTSFLESRIEFMIKSQRMFNSHPQAPISNLNLNNNIFKPYFQNNIYQTPPKLVNQLENMIKYEPLTPPQQQFQQFTDQIQVYQTHAYQQQQLTPQINAFENLLKYQDNILNDQRFLANKSNIIQQLINNYPKVDLEENLQESQDAENNDDQNQLFPRYHQQVPQKKRQFPNSSVKIRNKQMTRFQSDRTSIKYQSSAKSIDPIDSKQGLLSFKVVIALKNIYKQQVRWICLDTLGIDGNNLDSLTVMDLGKSILKYFEYQLEKYEKISMFVKKYGEDMFFLEETLSLANLPLNNQTTIKIFQTLITDSQRRQPYHPQIKNQQKFFTNPSLTSLLKLSEANLKAVRNFKIKTNYGEVTFQNSVDISGVILDEIVIFKQDSVEFYPKDKFVQPIIGQGLNVPCIVKFYNFGKLQTKDKKDQEDYEGFKKRVSLWAVSHQMKIIEFKDGSLTVRLEHV